MPKLIITMPDGQEVTHELGEDQITVGRTGDNMIHIDDASVSSHHAQLLLTGGDYHLKDLNSTNGTRVNDRSVDGALLHDGDRVRFGKIAAVYASEVASEAHPMPEEEDGDHHTKPAESSHRPSDFTNASPFKTKKKKKDPKGRAILAFSGVAILVFGAAIAKIFTLQPPQ